MISAGDFVKGTTFKLDGDICQVQQFQHVKPGKGPAFMKIKYRNLNTDSIIEDTFNPNTKYEPVFLEYREMSYIYTDGTFYYFMDNDTYEQIPIEARFIGEQLDFLTEGMDCTITFAEGKVIDVKLPIFVVLEVTKAAPGVKGNTASTANKDAVVETGAKIKVPLFVDKGDKIKIDTRTGEYIERA